MQSRMPEELATWLAAAESEQAERHAREWAALRARNRAMWRQLAIAVASLAGGMAATVWLATSESPMLTAAAVAVGVAAQVPGCRFVLRYT